MRDYGLLKLDICTGIESTAPRIKSDFKPEHDDLVQAQKRKHLRKQRRVKRIATVVIGYAIMAWMIYLIIVTARTVPKIWDPYDILGISRVSPLRGHPVQLQSQLLTTIFNLLECR